MDPQRQVSFTFSPFRYEAKNRRLMHRRIPVQINRQMLDLLELLLLNAGELVTRDQIQQALWPGQQLVNREKLITNAVSRLRSILRDDPAQPRFIESVPRAGYRFIAEVIAEEVAAVPMMTPAADPFEMEGSEALGRELAGAEIGDSVGPELLAASEIRFEPARVWRLVALAAVALVLVAGAAMAGWRWRSSRGVGAVPESVSLGIAPFQIVGPGAQDLAESFRLDLTDTLAQLPHVSVRASHSLDLMSLDGGTFREQVSKLGLDALLLGTFTLTGNDCHVQLELVRGKDLVHIATFDHTVSRFELASLRNRIQQETFSSLKLAPKSGGELPSTPLGGTSDPRAYDAYLRAGYHLSQESKDSLRLAIAEYDEAIADDPQFARAYAREARTFFYLAQSSMISEDEGFLKADEAARHALALAPSLAEAHAVLGFVEFLHNWNLGAGERELHQAIAIDPNEPFYHQGLALIFADEARFKEAEAEVDRAHLSDPFWVSAYVTELHVASVARDRGRVQIAMRKLRELAPESPHALDGMGNAEWNLGDYQKAIATWREMATIEGDTDRLAVEDRGLQALRKGGVEAYARVRLEAIHSGKGIQLHSNDFETAEWDGYANEPEEALKAIRAGIASHASFVLGVGVLPCYESLHDNSEYRSIVARLKLGPGTRVAPQEERVASAGR